MRARGVGLGAAFAGATILALAAVTACGGDDQFAGSSGQTSSPGMPGTDASIAPDALPRENPALCEGLVASPRVTDEIAKAGDAPPALGGAIALGVYDLEELYVYRAFDAGPPNVEGPTEGPSGRSVNAVLVVTKNTLAFLEAEGPTGALKPATARGYAYSPVASDLVVALVCPMAAVTTKIPYTAAGDALAIFPDATHRRVFRRRPE